MRKTSDFYPHEKVAKGTCKSKTGLIKTVCLFDPDTHEEIRKMAIRHNVSFAEQVRVLTEQALEDLREQQPE